MTAGAPWSVKGIDPKAREIAKDLARRSGMTLGEWLNRMIVEGDPIPAPDFSPEKAFDGPEEPLVIATPRASAESRYEIAGHPADEVGKVADAMERLTARIEAAEERSTLAISGIDQSVRGALARLSEAEREHTAVAARFEGAVDEIKTEYGGVGDRLRKVELESSGPRSAEALRSLEGMLGKVAGQFYDGEARTKDALAGVESRIAEIEKADPANLVEAVAARVAERLEEAESRTTSALRDLGASFVALDRRLRTVESAGTGAGAERLEALAADLTKRMEATRAELAGKLSASAEARFDRMDNKLSEMASHVAVAESRSAEAIERVGREMVSMTDTLSRRVQGVENRAADSIEQIGGEVARIATAVEHKLNRTDTAQAQALEKLGGEIARITERLTERIANSERRGALAIDEVGEQVVRVTERINQRQERTVSDLAERIRQSEERTARLLDEAREKIDASLNGSHRRLAEQLTPAPAPVARAPEPSREAFGDPFAADPFTASTRAIPEDAFAPQAFARPPAETPPSSLAQAPFPAVERDPPAFSDEDFEAADGFAPIDEHEPPVMDEVDVPPPPVIEPFEADEPARPRSTREVIEQARLAARSSSSPEPRAGMASSADGRSLFGAREKKPKRRAGSALQSALIFAVVGATGAALTVGVVLSINGEGKGETTARIAAMARIADADAKGEIKTREADTTPVLPTDATPMAAVATTDGAAAPLAGAAPGAPAAPVENAAALYVEGARLVAAGDNSGMAQIRKAANLGYAPAQYRLSKLYENGQGGLRKDLAEARRWTERAAQAGDRLAMHNLGLYYFEGSGGGKNTTIASQWFRKAADLGLTDSQYNLASLYEQGSGVSQNAAEAYKWYLIAARAGDGEAKSSAERVRRDLSAEARAAAERSAVGFRSATPNASTKAPATVAAGGPDVASAQRALSMLGYYRGPQDGANSAALKGAVQAFQREKGIAPTGNLDADTLSKLSIYAR